MGILISWQNKNTLTYLMFRDVFRTILRKYSEEIVNGFQPLTIFAKATS